jgi:serine/threonine-protein kinase
VGFAIGALGLVGIGVGTGYGLWALSKKDAYQRDHPNGQCTDCEAAENEKTSLERTSLISTLGFGVGAAGLVTGLYLVLTAPSTKSSTSVRFSPMLGGSVSGVAIRGRF